MLLFSLNDFFSIVTRNNCQRFISEMKFLIDFTDNIRFECILIVLNKFRNSFVYDT